jgi:hypothetical protein
MTPTEESNDGSHDAALERKISNSYRETLSLVVTEEAALARARANPDEALPLCITFSHGDRDNPRCWSKARKWYITMIVSMLNVITYVLAVHT